jgi:hypothetical protein
LIGKWDEDEAAKDVKTWETVEGVENALNHIIKKYLWIKESKKIDPSKLWEDAEDLITNTLLFDKEFHQFALYNYRVFIKYNEKNNSLDVIKMKY